MARARQRRCYQRKFGKGSYACWGALADAPIVRASAAPLNAMPLLPPGRALGYVLSEEWEAEKVQAFRDAATKQAARAERGVAQATAEIAAATRRLVAWQRKLRRAQQMRTMTAAEITALGEKRRAAYIKGRAAKPVRRGLDLRHEGAR